MLRLRPWDDAIAVTAGQVREVFQRLYVAGQWQIGDPPVLVVFDAGYDVTRLASCSRTCPWSYWAGCVRTESCTFRLRRSRRASAGVNPSTGQSSPSSARPPSRSRPSSR
ncbi:hypothetical protein [Streptomyces sp. NPDC055287]